MSDNNAQGIGRSGFVAEHGLHTEEQVAATERVVSRIRELDLRTVRIVVVDQHGISRSKFLSADAAIAGLHNGVDFSGAIYSLDSGNGVFPPAFVEGGGFGIPEFTGFPDVVVVPDPTTFQVLPWADRTGWLLCDAYFSNGKPLPLDGRRILRTQLERLGAAGYRYLAGLEVEFYIVRRESGLIALDETGAPPPPPRVDVFQQGYQFLSEARLDGVNETLTVLRDALHDVGLPPRSMEDEWGPGQMEFTFSPREGLGAADAMVLFRSTVKQVCQRRGLLASFMCRPGLPNFFSSGWHLHESLLDAAGSNVFASSTNDTLSPVGEQYVAGLLEHAQGMTLFTTPTVNGFSRFQPYSFAPDRVGWAVENRGAMVRVQGGPGDPGTHLENRLGEPAANPYLYMAADIAAGLDGITRGLVPPPPVDADPYAADNTPLPTSFAAGIEALAAEPLYRQQFGDGFVDYYLMMKRAELARYQAAAKEEPAPEGSTTTPWEMREYFEIF